MTTHYIDITLLPDPEFSHAHLLGALVSKLHRALVQLQASDIGVSYPRHVSQPAGKRTLGSVLRLHGTEAALARLMALDWLKGMRDHSTITAAVVAPHDATHVIVRRRQFKTNVDRLRRRRMQRKGETAEQAAIALPQDIEQRPDLPYVQIRSSSTAQPFCLFIEHRPSPSGDGPTGAFNTYGLSQDSAVPWF